MTAKVYEGPAAFKSTVSSRTVSPPPSFSLASHHACGVVLAASEALETTGRIEHAVLHSRSGNFESNGLAGGMMTV